MSIIGSLTRGIRFDTKKFNQDAKLFGMGKRVANVDVNEEPKNEFVPEEPTRISSSSDDDVDNDEDDGSITLLGDLKAKPGASKKRKKRAKGKETSLEKRKKLREESINRLRNIHRIHVTGSDIPKPIEDWSGLKVPLKIAETVESRYPSGPTAIQMQAIPMLMANRSVLACAPTGSGKTAAYLLPLAGFLNDESQAENTSCRAVIVAPTRELALQIFREAEVLIPNKSFLLLETPGHRKKKLEAKKHSPKWPVLISTPNKLAYLLTEGHFSLTDIEWLVVDEADRLFEEGFREQLAVIYNACSNSKKLTNKAMFSATLTTEVEQWCKLNLNNVLTVTIGARNSATETVEQKLSYVGNEKGKLLAFKELISEGVKPPVLVFVQSKERAKELYDYISNWRPNIKLHYISSDKSELERDLIVQHFRCGMTWILICTELMGRGIDFKGVNLVVNYDFPSSTLQYIHRVGRTGRAGRPGKAVTFFTDEDKTLLRSIATVVNNSRQGSVSDYMLKLNKASRQDKRKLAKHAVKREVINAKSKQIESKKRKMKEMVAASKRRKRASTASDK